MPAAKGPKMTRAEKPKQQSKTSEEDSKGVASGSGKGYGGYESDYCTDCGMAVWCSGNALVLINAVALHRAQLVLGWVTAFG